MSKGPNGEKCSAEHNEHKMQRRRKNPSYFSYWGKAKKETGSEGPDYHLLPYHCLDVAAVSLIWWQCSLAIRHSFKALTGLNEDKAKAWLLFFVALHDYGKWDIRFQRKACIAWRNVNPVVSSRDAPLSQKQINEYNHGPSGLSWLMSDFSDRFQSDWLCCEKNKDWELWRPWMAAVAGHHGVVPDPERWDDADIALPSGCDERIKLAFEESRKEWLSLLEQLFLKPAGLVLSDNPPPLPSTTALAGFCSVCDWIGSSDYFSYNDQPQTTFENIKKWFESRLACAEAALRNAGMVSHVNPDPSVDKLLVDQQSRQVQCLLPALPKCNSLTLIEASTGSGKTEVALAYAWELLEQSLADSIVFALPTQATANAMLKRLEAAAPVIFDQQSNLVLAHGKAKYQQDFIDLQRAGIASTLQGREEAWVQCGEWLAQSRKRVFLGQIGVCTVDQVLMSVLPIKHNFVRGFGVGRSVLIVDEVHAYDSYMYELLCKVLQEQHQVGGSAILLSATLPQNQKSRLAQSWRSELDRQVDEYPLITHCSGSGAQIFDLQEYPDQRPPEESVTVELFASDRMVPNEAILSRITDAVKTGAQVCFVCNLVDVAQCLYQQLRAVFEQEDSLDGRQVSLFHSRFTFIDRQHKEQKVLDTFGRNPNPANARDKGHLLIATQVVEQSLDIDFDWMLTQLCPVDLLFQRLGRLHRHDRKTRPPGFEHKRCTVLVPSSPDYQLHALIYGNSRVLWRTHQLLQKTVAENNSEITFPGAYRKWIEPVYAQKAWPDEPECIVDSFEKFEQEQSASRYAACSLMARTFSLEDTDSNAACLTRDGEMGLNLVPYLENSQVDKTLLNGREVSGLEGGQYFEAINLNTVPVPASWRKARSGQLPEPDENGLVWLKMNCMKKLFQSRYGKYTYQYEPETGLQRIESKEKDAP